MSRTGDSFTPQALLPLLISTTSARRWLVGYSGGADSTALLLAMHQLAKDYFTEFSAPLEAVHFNHGLQRQADAWEQHCRQFCQQHEIPLQVHQLSVKFAEGSSPETAAREARYQAIAQLLEKGDIYLTAHQADDQAETLFLNLMRGSGAEGLSGIPAMRHFAGGQLARPLLGFRRKALEDFLTTENVNWVVDPSNQDFGPDRNFLRGTIFPQLDQRWPGLVTRLNQTSKHLREQANSLRELLKLTAGMVSEEGITLPLKPLKHCSLQLQAEIIRNWVNSAAVRPPPRARLQEFLHQLKDLRHDSQAEIRWSDHLIKHHAGHLWMHELPGPGDCPARLWQMRDRLELGEQHGHLHIEGKGHPLEIKARVCSRSAVRDGSVLGLANMKQVKEIMRLSGVPSWLRDTVPVLLTDGKLAAVGDWWLARDFEQELGRANLSYRWEPEHRLLKKIQLVCHNQAVDPNPTLV